MLLEKYMNSQNLPYNCKSIFGNAADPIIREKYLLREIPNEMIKNKIITAITSTSRAGKMEAFENITTEIFSQTGGFNIDGFKLKSDIDV